MTKTGRDPYSGQQEILLSARNLNKYFGHIHAVRGIDLDIQRGKTIGLLGHNGAGKTTTLEILEGISHPNSGEIRFKNHPIGKAYQQSIGIMFQKTALPEFITIRETLELFANLYPHHSTHLDQLLRICGLHDLQDRDNRHLSGGQRQRLLLAIALVNDPDLIFLDEPTTGLDPRARREFWTILEKMKSQNKTILMSSHYMEEIYQLCDEVIIMHNGRILTHGSPDNLLSRHFKGAIIELPEKAIPDSINVHATIIPIHNHLEIHTDNIEKTLKILIEKKIPLEHISIRKHTLEDLFLELTQP